jgi:hypothetical protein
VADRSDEGSAVPEKVAELAASRDYGEFRGTVTLANIGGAGMFYLLAFLLVLIGIIVAAGIRTLPSVLIGGALVALAALLVFYLARGIRSAKAAAARAHLFTGGIVMAEGDQLTPYAWTDLDAVTSKETHLIGQSQHPQDFAFFELRTKSGDRILRVGEIHINQIKPLAEAGGAGVATPGPGTRGY